MIAKSAVITSSYCTTFNRTVVICYLSFDCSAVKGSDSNASTTSVGPYLLSDRIRYRIYEKDCLAGDAFERAAGRSIQLPGNSACLVGQPSRLNGEVHSLCHRHGLLRA